MQTINDVHQQFAAFFKSTTLQPFAYLVMKRLSEGHTCLHLQQPNLLPDEMVQLEKYGLPLNMAQLANEPMVAGEGDPKQPFVLHNHRLYLQRYFEYESGIVHSIQSLLAGENDQLEQRKTTLLQHQAFISSLSVATVESEPLTAAEKTDWQQVAAILAALQNFTIVTGGPGTGKTTTLAKILAILYTIQPGLKVALAAPTGKAAMRMAESLKDSKINVPPQLMEQLSQLVPGTIHRLLKFIPNSPYFHYDASNPLPYDLVIVDEASMIDVALFAKLLSAIGPQTRLILLGDKDQLASVEAGSLLGDLCQTQPTMNVLSADHVQFINSFIPATTAAIGKDFVGPPSHPLAQHLVELKRSRRFTGAGGIGQLSKAVLHSRLEEIGNMVDRNNDEQVSVDVTYNESVFNQFIEGYAAYINTEPIGEALRLFNQLRVLCAVREGPYGLTAINKKIEVRLAGKGLLQTAGEFYLNRPVIVTRNYPELKLFNGDVGVIRPDETGSLKAWFEDSDQQLRSVLPGYITSAETVFAMTIHKSQGSEYPRVLVMLPNKADHPLLSRELLYTAITRAREKVLIQASREVLLYTAGRSVTRASGIMERF